MSDEHHDHKSIYRTCVRCDTSGSRPRLAACLFASVITMSDAEVGDRIRAYRQRHSLTRTQFGDLVGVRRATIGDWESGRVAPTPENAVQLDEVLANDPRPKSSYWADWTITSKLVGLLGRVRRLVAEVPVASEVEDRILDTEDFLAALRQLPQLRREVDRVEACLLEALVDHGMTWTDIGTAGYGNASGAVARRRYERVHSKSNNT
jgi:DNA-binding XRE family transcriptional regulator